MGITPTYGGISDPSLINFTFSEIATGTGVVLFNSYATTSSGATATPPTDAPKITKSNTTSIDAIKSAPVKTSGLANTTSFVLTKSVEFNNAVSNLSSVVRGDASVDVTFVLDAATQNSQGYIVCKVQKVDEDDNVTTIGETTSDLFKTTPGVELPKTLLIPISCTQTTINPTDYLRLTIEMWAKVAAGGSSSHWILHDPANRDIASNPTITAADNHTYLKWYIPYKVDV